MLLVGRYVVKSAPMFNCAGVKVENRVRRGGIVVSRLAYRSGVYHQTIASCYAHRMMAMPQKEILVFRQPYFRQSGRIGVEIRLFIPGACMPDEQSARAEGKRGFDRQSFDPSSVRGCEVFARPIGAIEHSAFFVGEQFSTDIGVMIAAYHNGSEVQENLANFIDVRIVADDVASAYPAIHRRSGLDHCFQRRPIPMDIGNDGESHRRGPARMLELSCTKGDRMPAGQLRNALCGAASVTASSSAMGTI
jgi:hypothetical protein